MFKDKIKIINDGETGNNMKVIMSDGKELPYVTKISIDMEVNKFNKAEITIVVPSIDIELPENFVNIKKLDIEDLK